MTHKKSLIFATVFALACSGSLAAPALARGLEGGREGMSDEQKQKVEDRKTEIKQRVEAVKAERASKLADRKLENCEKREAKINSIFTKATERNMKQLAVFQKIEERVKAFYVDKNINTEGYEAAVTSADDKEAAAVAAIEASNEVTFDCSATDPVKPGAVVKSSMEARHSALKEYRTAIKDLILVVKQGNGQNRTGTDDSTAQPEAEADTETEAGTETTGGAQ